MNSREQRLVDLMFEIAQLSAKYWSNMPREDHMEWVAKQLRENGFDTVPMGLSWGVLK